MLMQQISLYDEVNLKVTTTPGIRVVTDSAAVPEDSGNIAWRAATALLQRADCQAGVEITILKRIPVAAGLGGGSSNAAATLTGLNNLLALGATTEELMTIGLQLGADVPFFVYGKAAIAEGVGEKLTAVPGLPQLPLVIVNPGFHVATAWVYQNLRLTTEKVAAKIPVLYESAADLCGILANDLEAVTISRFPVICEIKKQLMAAGAIGALMSGSGPSVFAVFTDETTAAAAARELARTNNGWFTAAVSTI
jgi:4-diphosphocytidyl-2-C-methyl-D-erythritol kinase